MSKKQVLKFKALIHGVKQNPYCWQEVSEKVKGLGVITRHTRVEIIDVDKTNQTVLIQYLLGSGMKKLSSSEFDKMKLFR